MLWLAQSELFQYSFPCDLSCKLISGFHIIKVSCVHNYGMYCSFYDWIDGIRFLKKYQNNRNAEPYWWTSILGEIKQIFLPSSGYCHVGFEVKMKRLPREKLRQNTEKMVTSIWIHRLLEFDCKYNGGNAVYRTI